MIIIIFYKITEMLFYRNMSPDVYMCTKYRDEKQRTVKLIIYHVKNQIS